VNVGPRLAASIPTADEPFTTYLGSPINSSFFLSPTSPMESEAIISSLPLSKAT
jgi:hypothetical protein